MDFSTYGMTLYERGYTAGVSSSWDFPFRFQSKMQDTAGHLLYFGMRYYHPGMGRFINRDPIGENGGLNVHAYCSNDPGNRGDILGLKWVWGITGYESTGEMRWDYDSESQWIYGFFVSPTEIEVWGWIWEEDENDTTDSEGYGSTTGGGSSRSDSSGQDAQREQELRSSKFMECLQEAKREYEVSQKVAFNWHRQGLESFVRRGIIRDVAVGVAYARLGIRTAGLFRQSATISRVQALMHRGTLVGTDRSNILWLARIDRNYRMVTNISGIAAGLGGGLVGDVISDGDIDTLPQLGNVTDTIARSGFLFGALTTYADAIPIFESLGADPFTNSWDDAYSQRDDFLDMFPTMAYDISETFLAFGEYLIKNIDRYGARVAECTEFFGE